MTRMKQKRNSAWSHQKNGVKAYTRVWEVAPSSSNIVKDIDKVLKSMRIIFKAEGVADNDIADRQGKRFIASGNNHGGARKRLKRGDDYGNDHVVLHEDAQRFSKKIIAKAELKMEHTENNN